MKSLATALGTLILYYGAYFCRVVVLVRVHPRFFTMITVKVIKKCKLIVVYQSIKYSKIIDIVINYNIYSDIIIF